MGDTRASSFKRDLNSLESGSRKVGALSIVEAAGLRPATRGVSVYVQPASTGGGGIASPLEETDVTAREYHPNTMYVASTDGVIVFGFRSIKQLEMTDANSEVVVFKYAEPSTGP